MKSVLSFGYLGIFSFFPYFWKIGLLDIEFLVDYILLSTFSICCPTVFWPQWFSVRNPLLILLRWPFFMWWHIFSHCLKMLFVVGFLQFDYDVSRYESPWVYPTWSFLSFLDMYINVCHKIVVILSDYWASLIAQLVKNLPAMLETLVWFLGQEDRFLGQEDRFLGQEDLLKKIGYPFQYSWVSLVAQLVKNPPAMQETWIRSLGREDPLEKGKVPTPVFWP